MKHRFLIVADDLTGSCDSGVQAARRGIVSRVVFSDSAEKYAKSANDSELLIIDTETRAVSDETAFNAICRQLRDFDFSGCAAVIKKTDSTLRGNCAREIRALDTLYKSSLVFFMPALPVLGRTTVHEVQLLNETPLLQTEFARDPVTPVLQDNIRLLLQEAFEEPVTHITLEKLRSAEFTLPQGRIFTCDAQTSSDMEKAVAAVHAAKKERVLWAGSAGIAEILFQTEHKPRPALAVVASMSAVTARQVTHAVQSGAFLVPVPAEAFALSPAEGKGADDENRETKLLQNCVHRAADALRNGRDVLLASGAACGGISDSDAACGNWKETGGQKIGKNHDHQSGTAEQSVSQEQSRQTASRLKTFLATAATQIIGACPVSGVFLTGGDTAAGFCEAAAITGFSIKGEVASGIPLLTADGGPFDGMRVITKAGAFGNDDAITFALRKLKEKSDAR